jgi:ABC-type branched-subunit amino acid transport system substrate-binding protein
MLAMVALIGCSTASEIQPGKSRVNVYVSMPLRGQGGGDGQDVVDGTRMALDDAGGRVGALGVRGVYMDDTAGDGAAARWNAARVGQNARRATEDSTAIAYIGDFESGASRTSIPITNEASLLQVSPASTAVDLARPYVGSQQLPDIQKAADERTFGRVIPDDEVQHRAAVAWSKKVGTRVVTDRKLPPFSTPPTGIDYATSAALDPSQLPADGQEFVADFRKRYSREPGRYAAYGYEAMAVVLDSINRAGSEGAHRQSVIDAFFGTTDRHSILGSYSIDQVGDTSLSRITGYRLIGGRTQPAAVLGAG